MILNAEERHLVAEARTATLGTIDPHGRPRLVPICFVLDGQQLWSPLDEKAKSSADPRSLARVRDILARSDVTLLVDRWSEDWTKLAWIRLNGRASLVEPDADDIDRQLVIRALRAKYPQYEDHDLATRPMIQVDIDDATSWGALA
ncbi:MAG: pyridoxamine 5'-phosphate oxidase family protein [Candidatus Limnocylindrales bacterium]